MQRGKEPLAGYWSLPGGAVETGEPLEEAMRREVYEETGLRVQVGSIATVFERIIPDDEGKCEYHYVLVDFFCSILSGEARAGDDSRAVGWFPIANLDDLHLTTGTKTVVEACCGSAPTFIVLARP